MNQSLEISVGENPPEVAATAIALIVTFSDSEGGVNDIPEGQFLALAAHYVAPDVYPLGEALPVDSIHSGIADLIEGSGDQRVLKERTRKALELIERSPETNRLATLLGFLREKVTASE